MTVSNRWGGTVNEVLIAHFSLSAAKLAPPSHSYNVNKLNPIRFTVSCLSRPSRGQCLKTAKEGSPPGAFPSFTDEKLFEVISESPKKIVI